MAHRRTRKKSDCAGGDATEQKDAENEPREYRNHLEESLRECRAELSRANELLEQEERDRAKAQEKLRMSELRIRSFLEQTTDAVFCYECDPPIPVDLPIDEQVRLLYDCVLVECNDACAKSYGAERADEIIGGKLTELFGTTPGSLDKLFRALIQGGYRIVDGEGVEKLEDGTERHYLNNGHGIIEDGKLIQVWGAFRNVTDHKKVSAALRESENLYRSVVENAGEGIAVTQDGLPRFVNSRLAVIMGYPEEESTSRPFIEFVHPDDRDRVTDIHTRRMRGEQVPGIYELRVIDKHGNTKWLENNGVLIEWNGRPATLNFLRDITDRKRADEALLSSSNVLKESQEVASLGHYAFDTRTGLWEGSEILDKIFGFGEDYPKTIDGWQRIVHPDERGEMSAYLLRTVLEQGEPFDREYRIVRLSDNQVRWVHGLGRLEFNEDGRPVRMIGTIQDVTERKEMEEKLRFLSLMTEQVADSVISTNSKFEITWVNRSFQRLYGYSLEEVMGKSPAFLNAESDSANIQSDIYAKVKLGKVWRGEILNRKKDGTVFPCELMVFPLFDGQGNVFAYASYQRDISERKRAEETLRSSEIRHRELFDNMSSGVAVYEPVEDGTDFVFKDFNRAAERIDRVNKEDIVGRKVTEVFSGIREFGLLDVFQRVWRTGKPEHHPVSLYKDEKLTSWFNNYVYRLPSGEIIAVHDDVTESKKAQEKLLEDRAQLKSLASQLSCLEERERHRLATALHDQIGQSLVFSKLKLDELRTSDRAGDPTNTLDEVRDCLARVIQETRTLTFDLCSPILYELGLEAAVAEWLNDEIRDKHGIETEFDDDGRPKPLDDDIRAILFRNVRELLINVVKHARANKVKVSICGIDEDICVSVEDDGVGFDPAEVKSTAAKSDKFGLFSIRERLEQLGGLIEIDSKPGGGSRILMKAPLKCEKLTDGKEL